MSSIIKLFKKIKNNPEKIPLNILYRIPFITKKMSDEKYLKLVYRLTFHKKLDLQNPKTYNEKLQWLKLYDRKDIYTKMVDKYEAKKYVADIIGEEYIIPTLGVYNNFNEIDFDKLPNQFVIKCTHDSGTVIICDDKKLFDKDMAQKKINKALKKNYYWICREWPYKNLKPRIIIEKYIMDTKSKSTDDYKFFCFDGVMKFLFVATERMKNTETKFDFYDRNFKHLDLKNGHPNSNIENIKPINFDKMILLSEKLSKNIPHVRVDFYNIDGQIYFGEITFFHYGGFVPFKPSSYDLEFGKYIELPRKVLSNE